MRISGILFKHNYRTIVLKILNYRYKRDATLIYLRLFRGSPGNYDAGSDLPPVKARITGCWCSKLELPGLDVGSDNGDDGDTILKATINYDDVFLEK